MKITMDKEEVGINRARVVKIAIAYAEANNQGDVMSVSSMEVTNPVLKAIQTFVETHLGNIDSLMRCDFETVELDSESFMYKVMTYSKQEISDLMSEIIRENW